MTTPIVASGKRRGRPKTKAAYLQVWTDADVEAMLNRIDPNHTYGFRASLANKALREHLIAKGYSRKRDPQQK